MKRTVGIDLGTTNSAVARLVDRRPVLVPDSAGNVLLPSVVGFDAAGQLLVGRSARNQLVVAPERTVRSVKRAMGGPTRFPIGGRDWSAPELSALILRALADRVAAATGQRPEAAVITVPAWFTEPQREATREAGVLAGLEVARLVNEPTAAALTYEGELDERMLVFDLGGGTFDVSVVERGLDFTEVLASRGDTALGGDDLDVALARRLAEQWGRPAVQEDPIAWARLIAAAERAKIALSTRTTVRVQETFLAGGAHLDVLLTREELEEVARPLLLPTLAHIQAALADAKVRPEELSRILLVGGMTRMPIVHRLLHEALGIPAHHEVDPDASVALGAAVLAARIAGEAVEAMLVDVTPQSISIATHNDANPADPHAAVVIERNTVVPVTRSRTFYTMPEGQLAARIELGQGESTRFSELTRLDAFLLDRLDGRPSAAIDIVMHLDVSGVLKVTAVDRATGRDKAHTIQGEANKLAERRRAGGQAAVAETTAAPGLAEAYAAAERLLTQARAAEGGDEAGRARVQAAIAALDAACATERLPAIERASDALADALLDLLF